MNSVCTLCCDGCKEHGERVERDRILTLILDNFYPLEYKRWQADELLDQLIALIKGNK